MSIVDASNIKYAGGTYKSVVILDSNEELRVAPSLFLAEQSISASSTNTIKNYGYRLNSFLAVLDYSKLNWQTISQVQIDTYINSYLRETLSLSESSLLGHIATLTAFYEFAWNHGFLSEPMTFRYRIVESGIAKKPELKQSKDHYRLIEKYITKDKFNELLESIDNKSDYIQERNELIFHFGYYMGLRAGEIVDSRNLRIQKLWDNENSTVLDKISIIGKGEKHRFVNIPFVLKEKIKNFIIGRRKNISGNLLICSKKGAPLNRALPSKLFFEAAKLTTSSFYLTRSFHSLRHSFATNLVISCYERGHDPWVVVPEQMGHSDNITTFNYIFFEAVLNTRHSILKKLAVQSSHINRKERWKRK
jgi:site-specific recombinase XerD